MGARTGPPPADRLSLLACQRTRPFRPPAGEAGAQTGRSIPANRQAGLAQSTVSIVPLFYCSIVQLFSCSIISPWFVSSQTILFGLWDTDRGDLSNPPFLLFNYSIIQLFYYSNVQQRNPCNPLIY